MKADNCRSTQHSRRRLVSSVWAFSVAIVLLFLAVGWSVYSSLEQEVRIVRLEESPCKVNEQGDTVNPKQCRREAVNTDRDRPRKDFCIGIRKVASDRSFLQGTICDVPERLSKSTRAGPARSR